MENVKGMLNWEKGKAIEAVLNEFREPIEFNDKEYYYEVTYKVLNASSYGVPQHRERLFIVGNRLGKSFKFPQKTHASQDKCEPNLFGESPLPHVTAWDAFGDLPPAEQPSAVALRVSKTIKGRIEKHGY